jgi:hypothetical protein
LFHWDPLAERKQEILRLSPGTATWTAANGDIITTVVGSPERVDMAPCQVVGAQPGDTYVKVTEIHTIITGKGRFAGTQGSFILTLYHDMIRLGADLNTHATCRSFGTITLARVTQLRPVNTRAE